MCAVDVVAESLGGRKEKVNLGPLPWIVVPIPEELSAHVLGGSLEVKNVRPIHLCHRLILAYSNPVTSLARLSDPTRSRSRVPGATSISVPSREQPGLTLEVQLLSEQGRQAWPSKWRQLGQRYRGVPPADFIVPTRTALVAGTTTIGDPPDRKVEKVATISASRSRARARWTCMRIAA